eukprot:754809-Hanusia_phi.AAC.1
MHLQVELLPLTFAVDLQTFFREVFCLQRNFSLSFLTPLAASAQHLQLGGDDGDAGGKWRRQVKERL